MKQYSVTLGNNNKTETFDRGTLLLDALIDMGLSMSTPCGGKGTCGKCAVEVKGDLSEKNEIEKKILEDTPHLRLACQACLRGNVTVQADQITSLKSVSYPTIDIDKPFSVAVDIGTTSVQISLVDLSEKSAILIDEFLNPQRRFGHDVITRISASSDPPTFKKMVQLIRDGIFSSITRALEMVSLPSKKIEKIVFSGNTTMLHLLFGLDVSSIGVYPYRASRLVFDDLTPADIEADMFPTSRIYALPAISSFLGGDLTGSLSVCYERGFTNSTFFIDLGTNGEIFLINKQGEIFSASCAMGPALEGMNISYGMTAEDGAITHVRLENESLHYEMLGHGSPVGIAGTALIDIVAIFLEINIIKENGAISNNPEGRKLPEPAALSRKGDMLQIELWGNISLNQRDVRNLQLARAASLAASRFILKKGRCSLDEIQHVLIAGAFGKYLDLENFKRLSFIPNFKDATYHFLGNTSLKAAERVCIEKDFLDKASILKSRVTEVELALNPEFNNELIAALDYNPN